MSTDTDVREMKRGYFQ